MNHANAALSLNKRRLLCQRVVEEGWTLTEAAAAAEVSGAARQVGAATARRASRPARSLVGAAPVARTSEERVEAIAALRRLRFTGPEIAELLGMALSTVSGILTRIGMGKLGRLGLEPAAATSAPPGELVHVDVKKLGRIERGAGKRFTGQPPSTSRAPTRRRAGPRPAGSSSTSRSTTAPGSPTPRSRRREGGHGDRFLRRALAFFAATASRSSA